MVQNIQRPVRLAAMALFAATMTGLPAAAQEFSEQCTIKPGRVPADQLTECFQALDVRINSLPSGGDLAAEVNNKLENLLAQINTLESELASLQSTIGDLPARQPEIREDINFGVANRAESDGLVIAYFTAKPDPGSTWATIDGYVDEEVELTTVDPKVLRASDSFLASEDLWGERSAAIVMPVFEGEYYKVELTVSDAFDEEKHIRKIYFVSF